MAAAVQASMCNVSFARRPSQRDWRQNSPDGFEGGRDQVRFRLFSLVARCHAQRVENVEKANPNGTTEEGGMQLKVELDASASELYREDRGGDRRG